MNKKAERGQATRRQILTVATRLFTRFGYEKTSVDALLRELSISRGALYHHFKNKKALFSAVLESAEEEIAHALPGAAEQTLHPVDALKAACESWLRLAREDRIRQIVLIDAPAVLGWKKWRELDARYSFGFLKASLHLAARAGKIRKERVEVFAHMLLAALVEVALLIARAENPKTAALSGTAAFSELLDRLFATIDPTPRS